MLLAKAQEIKKVNFADEITFVYSAESESINHNCDACINYAHKNGHNLCKQADYSKNIDISLERECCEQVGLVTEAEALEISKTKEKAVFDFFACNNTIYNLYGNPNITSDDYLSSYRILQSYIHVIPRINIGINNGKSSGELSALSMLAKENPSTLVFVVYDHDSAQENDLSKMPGLDYVLDILIQARIMFPETDIHLGCLRPQGKYRNDLDYRALQAGVNRIVSPSWKARKYAESAGYNIFWKKKCW